MRSHHSHQQHRVCRQGHTPQPHHEVSLLVQQMSMCQSLSHTCHITAEKYQSYTQGAAVVTNHNTISIV